MKTQITEEIVNIPIPAEEIETLKAVINKEWDSFYSADELANDIEKGFIFGKYAANKHYLKEFIHSLINEVELEKNPPPIVEELPLEEIPIVIPE